MSKTSFDNIKDKWIQELKQYSPGTPIILVGTKVDLRSDEEEVKKIRERHDDIVTKEMGDALAKDLKAVAYLETSARAQIGVREIFDKAIEVRFQKKGASQTKASGGSQDGCCILQ